MTTESPSTQAPGQLSRSPVTLIAVATGAVVANLYYAQPLLHLVAHDFHSASGLASLIITATQVGYATSATLVAGVLLTGSFGLLWFGHSALAALIVGIVVLDIGTQGMQITNQAIIYALRPDARSRINSAYMVCYFIGGAAGSLIAGVVYGSHRWAGVCILGAGFGALSLASTLYERLRPSLGKPAPRVNGVRTSG